MIGNRHKLNRNQDRQHALFIDCVRWEMEKKNILLTFSNGAKMFGQNVCSLSSDIKPNLLMTKVCCGW